MSLCFNDDKAYNKAASNTIVAHCPSLCTEQMDVKQYLCIQVLPFLFDYKLGRIDSPLPQCSVVVVVSPMASLMVDQATSLRFRGVSAAWEVWRNCKSGKL